MNSRSEKEQKKSFPILQVRLHFLYDKYNAFI